MCGGEDSNYSPCEAMAPPMEPEPMRMCFSFPLFQLGFKHARKKLYSTHDPDQTLVSKRAQGVLRGAGGPTCPQQSEDRMDFTLVNKENVNLCCGV